MALGSHRANVVKGLASVDPSARRLRVERPSERKCYIRRGRCRRRVRTSSGGGEKDVGTEGQWGKEDEETGFGVILLGTAAQPYPFWSRWTEIEGGHLSGLGAWGERRWRI